MSVFFFLIGAVRNKTPALLQREKAVFRREVAWASVEGDGDDSPPLKTRLVGDMFAVSPMATSYVVLVKCWLMRRYQLHVERRVILSLYAVFC